MRNIEANQIGANLFEAMSPEEVMDRLREKIGEQVEASNFDGTIYFRLAADKTILVTFDPSKDTRIILKVDETTNLDEFLQKTRAILTKYGV